MAVKDNSTVRWFTSDMAGSPQVDDSPGCLVSILDACLINGFGHKAPDGNMITVSGGVATVEFSSGHDFEKHVVIEIEGATPESLNDVWRITGTTATTLTFDCPGIPDGNGTGSIIVKRATPGYWEKAFGDSLKGAYRSTHPESNGYFLRVDATAATSDGTKIRGYTSMTDVDTGEGAFPTFDLRSETSYGWRLQYSSLYSYTGWALVADARMIYFFPNFRDSGDTPIHYFGELDPLSITDFHATIIGAHTSLTPSYGQRDQENDQFDGSSAYSAYLAKHHDALPSDGAVSTVYLHSPFYSPGSGIGEAIVPYPNPYTGGHVFKGNAIVRDDQAIRGTFPGLLQSITGGRSVLGGKKAGIVEAGEEEPVILVSMVYGQIGFKAWGPWR